MSEDHALVSERDQIITVTINRPAKLNAISPQVTAALWEAVNALADRDDLRCMVITATGRYFSAGIDLKSGIGRRRGNPETAELHPGWNFRRNYRDHHLLYDEMETVEKPIILAAQGTCLGAGLEMAMSCDFRFCTPQAEWGVPEIKLGVIAGSGGSSRLQRAVGPSWAKYMSMSGRNISAERALAIGLVHEIFPAESFMNEVEAFCTHLVSLPQEALGVAKLAVDLAADIPNRDAQRHVDRIANYALIRNAAPNAARERFNK